MTDLGVLRHFWASRSVPIVYLNMPKSACTSIKNLLYLLDSGKRLGDPLAIHKRRDILIVSETEPKSILARLKSDVVFTFVRHPLRRAYSGFNEKIYFETEYSFPRTRNHIVRHYGAEFSSAPSLDAHRHNFKAFLRFVQDTHLGGSRLRGNSHWCPQSFIVKHASRWRMLDFIGRVESFDEHMSAVLALVGARYDSAMPRMNEGPLPPYSYEEILDGEIVEIARTLFERDLTSFGYSL